jgi:Putative adhesin
MSTPTPLPPTDPGTGPSAAEKVPDELFDPARRASAPMVHPSRSNVAAYVLILFGVLFLIATVVPIGGGVFLLGLGLAFLVARLATGRYGYAVPAGILSGLGTFVALQEAGILSGDNGGWALVFLGLGFLAIYPLGAYPRAYWPVIPGAIMIALGLALLDAAALAPLSAYTWVGQYWPVVLVLLGLWILARDAMSPRVRTVVGVVLVAALILAGALALAAATAASVGPIAGTVSRPTVLGAPMASLGQATTLTAPIAAGETLRITNATGGTTLVITGDPGQVRARVTRQMGWGPPASVDLAPSNGSMLLEARSAGIWPNQSPAASLVVEVPRDAPIAVQASSGDVDVEDRATGVQIVASSGSVTVARIDGPARLQTSSGNIRVADVTGDLDVVTSSGSVDASGIRHPRSVQTSSGRISLSGTFGDVTRVQSSSGEIALRLAADSSTRITASTSSGSISTGALELADVRQAPHSFAGTLGSGEGTLTITTSSGAIRLDALR